MSDVTLNPLIIPKFESPSQVQTTTAPETTETTTSPSYTPLWMINSSVGSNAFEMLGMRRPNANGDLAAMLAAISLTLETSIDESQKNKALAGLARMYSALGAFGIAELRGMITRSEETSAGITARVNQYNKDAAPNLAELDTLNASIATYDAQIATLTAQIAGLKTQLASAKDSEKPAIQTQINTATASLNSAISGRTTALADRKDVELELGQLQIDTLSAQLDDLKAQLAQAPADSTEATALNGLITDLTSRIDAMTADLEDLPGETYADRSDSPLYDDIAGNFSDGFAGVDQSVSKLLADGRAILTLTTILVMMLSAQTAATSDPTNIEAVNDALGHQTEVEDSFEDIADQMDEAAQRLQAMLNRFDKAADATEARIESVARALLAAISDILGALDGLDDSPGGAPPVGQTVGNRLRIGI